jgi:hypothetical protein
MGREARAVVLNVVSEFILFLNSSLPMHELHLDGSDGIKIGNGRKLRLDDTNGVSYSRTNLASCMPSSHSHSHIVHTHHARTSKLVESGHLQPYLVRTSPIL